MIKYVKTTNEEGTEVTNIEYWGGADMMKIDIDPETNELIRKSIYKDCVIEDNQGSIFGIEDNKVYNEFYFIVYVPILAEFKRVPLSDTEFIKTFAN